jgi:hypothetical protein
LIEKCDHKIHAPAIPDDFVQFGKIRTLSPAQQKRAANGGPCHQTRMA